MGKVEKIAVLSVLFLIAVILVVSLTTDNPLDTKNAAVLGEKAPAAGGADVKTAALADKGANPADPKASPLLSANVKTDTAAKPEVATGVTPAQVPAPEALSVPAGSPLKSTEGLGKGFDDKRFVYTWKSGDSYVALATRLYGEPAKFTLLKNANDGRDDMQPGDKILVPIFDVENVATDALASVPAETTKDSGKSSTKAAASKKSAKAPVASAAGRVHVVRKGESLWKIAKAELGDGNRWKEIYDANKDKLKTPEALRDGMELKLP